MAQTETSFRGQRGQEGILEPGGLCGGMRQCRVLGPHGGEKDWAGIQKA